MLKSIRIILTIHNHQPAGNFDRVIQDVADNSYIPLLRCLEKHPGIAMTLHYSGTLFSWLDQNRPEFSDLLHKIIKRGNVELLSGAYYEAILASIPEEDRIGQIKKHKLYLRNKYGYEAKGLWLAEKVWESNLPKSIEQANIRYTALDEESFILNGVDKLPVRAYYNTENEGHTVGVFPVSRKTTDRMLHTSPQDMINYLLSNISDNNQDMILIADDGEKYRSDSEGDGTASYNTWLDEFFTLIEENNEEIQSSTMNEYWESIPPKGIAYFSSDSYNDMQSWSLHNEQKSVYDDIVRHLSNLPDAEKYRPFLRGGIWRNFMTKYAESNWMQKRIQHINRKYKLLESQVKNKNRLRHIRDTLWLAMANDVFWHGHYGGIYLPHLRDATWKSIISAEGRIEDKLFNLRDGEFVHNEADFDRDGHVEIQISTKKYSAIFSKKYSGALVEFDYKRSGYNLFNSIRRYPEQYHKQIIEEKDKQFTDDPHFYDRYTTNGQIIFDKKPRYGLMERFFDKDITVEGLHANAYEEASDFINETVDICDHKCDRHLTFERKGWINWQRAKVKKHIFLNSSGFEVDYTLSNLGIGPHEFSFGPEFNFSLHSGEEHEKSLFSSVELGNSSYKDFLDLKEVSEFGFINKKEKVKVTLKFSKPVRLFQYPVETIVRTHQGFEKIYQNTCVLPLWHISLTPGKCRKMKITFLLEDI